MTNWKLDDNRSIVKLLIEEHNITIVILYQDDIERARIKMRLKTAIGAHMEGDTLWAIKLYNYNIVKFVPIQRAQIDTRGTNISLLLFPDSIEYNVRREITRELLVNMISSGGITGTIRV
jgi:hypothetical protein